VTARLFTFVSEFRGTTNVAQVCAPDERDAIRAWAETLRIERPFGRASSYIGKTAVADLEEKLPPIAIRGIPNVWCITGICGGDLMLANIVETASSADGS
jgi:hypothetical protein